MLVVPPNACCVVSECCMSVLLFFYPLPQEVLPVSDQLCKKNVLELLAWLNKGSIKIKSQIVR